MTDPTSKATRLRYRVVLVDDHAMLREGIRAILERDPFIEVVGEASDGREALKEIDRLVPDIVIMDIGMPNLNGVDATRQIVRSDPDIRVIALSTHNDKRFVLAMFEAGAHGYVAKEAVSEEITRAIHAVAEGKRYVSSEVAGLVIDHAGRSGPQDEWSMREKAISPREREVLQLLAEGKTSAEVAELLHLSVHTVDTHRRNIMRKTGTHSVAELTKLAIREGLTSI